MFIVPVWNVDKGTIWKLSDHDSQSFDKIERIINIIRSPKIDVNLNRIGILISTGSELAGFHLHPIGETFAAEPDDTLWRRFNNGIIKLRD